VNLNEKEKDKGGGGGAISPTFLSSLVEVVSVCVCDFKPQELANVLGGLGKMKARPSISFLTKVADLVQSKMGVNVRVGVSVNNNEWFTPSDMSNVCFGLVKMRYRPTKEFVGCVERWGERVIRQAEGEVEEGRKRGGRRGGGGEKGVAAAMVRDVGHVLNTYVRVGVQPEEAVLERCKQLLLSPLSDVSGDTHINTHTHTHARSSLSVAPLQSLTMITTAFARFEFHPGQVFLSEVTEAALGGSGAQTHTHTQTHTQTPPRPTTLSSGSGSGSSESTLHTALLLHALSKLGHEPTRTQLDVALGRLAARLENLTT
jgi:hypothetical protein